MQRFLSVLVGLLALNCGDGVGSDDCFGAGVRCELPDSANEVGPELTEISTKGLEDVSPTWIHPLPILPPTPIYSNMLLTSDLEGGVWFFTQNSMQLVASELNADGEVAQSKAIDPPRGWVADEPGIVAISSSRLSAVGVALHIAWPVTVKADKLNSPGLVARVEWIKLGKSVDDPLQRIVPSSDTPFYNSDLTWGADGSVFALNQVGGLSIEKFDRKLNRVWKQSALRGVHRGEDVEISFGLLADHRVAVFIEVPSESHFAITVLGADGNFEPWFGQPGLNPTYAANPRFPQQGPNGPVLIANDAYGFGDLIVASMHAKPRALTGAKLLKEEYLTPHGSPNTIDRAGNVYLAPVLGGRTPRDQRRAICRVPVSGEPRCLLLARSPELEITDQNFWYVDLAVNADGVVFMRAEQSLIRIDFPEGS
jgi:hypothetical protein